MSEKEGKELSQEEKTSNQDVQEESLQSSDNEKDAMNDMLQVPDVERERNSPKLSPSQTESADATLEGAVGGEVEESSQQKDTENYVDINQQASALDKKRLCSGKLVVFRKYFERDDLLFCTKPDGRRRHTATRQRHCSEGNPPNSDQTSSNGFPVGYVPFDNGLEPLLNQAGAIIGIASKPSEFANMRGDGYVLPGYGRIKDPQHSVGSAETVPIGEIYSGNFSPPRPSSASSRGVSPGSFPSFSSRTPTASDSYILKISPLPDSGSTNEARRLSPSSTDSDKIQHDGSVRQRRYGVSQPIPVPLQSDSAHRRKISKDSSDLSERISSEEEGLNFPELSHSAESDHGLPISDLNKAALDKLDQNLESLRLSPNVSSGVPAQEEMVHNPRHETDESESEHDPVTVMSCSPDGAKDLKHPPPKD